MDGCADGNHFVGIDALVKVVSVEDLLGEFLHLGDANRTTNHDDLLHVGRLELCISKRLLARRSKAFEQILAEFFKLGAGQRDLQVLRTVLVRGDERQVDRGLHLSGEFNLGLLSSFLQALQSHWILADINALLLAEVFGQEVDELLVKVIAAEVSVTVRGEHFEHAVGNVQDGHIERSAAEIEHSDLRIGLLLKTVGECRGRWLVDDALDLEAGNFASVLGGLALRVVEVRGHSDDCAGDSFAKELFGLTLEVSQDHGGDFRRGVVLAADANFHHFVRSTLDGVGHQLLFVAHLTVAATHEALDAEDGVAGVGDLLVLGGLADEPFALLGEADHRGGGALTDGVDDDLGLGAFHDGDHAVGGAEVDSDDD